MVTWILGHEGGHSADSPVNMGTAVLRVGNDIVNGITGRRVPYSTEYIQKLVDKNSISLLPHSYRVTVEETDHPYFVRLDMNLADYLGLRVFSILKKWSYIRSRTHRDGTMNLLFRDFSCVAKWTNDVAINKLHDLEQKMYTPYGRRILQGLSVLSFDQPEIHAIRAVSSRYPCLSRDLFTSRFQGEPSDRFDAVFDRLMAKKVESIHAI